MIRVGLAGFSQGYYATEYMSYLERFKEISVAAVCDCGESEEYVKECALTTAQAFSEKMKAPLVHDYEEFLQCELDAVLICSETADHVRMAKAALERGLHVFISKPLCFSPDDAALLGRTPHNKVLLCGNPLKYEQSVEEMHARLAAGEIGPVHSLRITVSHPAMTAQAWERDPARSGGPFGTYAVYLFDLARWLTGQRLVWLCALGENFATPEIPGPDTIKIIGRCSGGTHVVLELFSSIRHEYPFVEMEAVGEQGTLITRNRNYSTVFQTQAGAVPGTLRTSNMTVGEMEHFLACIRGQDVPRCSLSDMAYTVRCLDAAQKSMASGRPAELPREEETT